MLLVKTQLQYIDCVSFMKKKKIEIDFQLKVFSIMSFSSAVFYLILQKNKHLGEWLCSFFLKEFPSTRARTLKGKN